MKRIILLALCLACLCTLVALPAAAEPADSQAVKFQKFLDRCDSLYDGNVIKLVLADALKAFASQENPEISVADFETELEKQIVLTEDVLNDIRSAERGLYDSEKNKYIVKAPDSVTEVSVARHYRGYVKTDENTYAVYYQNATREILDESPEIISQYKNPITGEVKYNGKVYLPAADVYYCIQSWDEGGMKYTVEDVNGKMRFVSGESFEAGQLPESFDDVVVTYDLPKDNTVFLDNVADFPDETIVKVEKITGVVPEIAQAMAQVSTKYVAYKFTATQNENPVQPNAKLKVHFAMPEDFSANTEVMHLDAEGKLTELSAMVKNIEGTSFLVTELEHFSTYLLVDMDKKPVVPTTEPTVEPTTAPTTTPTTVATQAATEATKATNAVTQATDGATKATNVPTQPTVAPASKPTSVTVVRPTVSATEAPTEQTAVDPTDETAEVPTEEASAPTVETSAAPTEPTKPAKANKTGGIIAAVIVVIVLAGGGFAAWWFYFRKKGRFLK